MATPAPGPTGSSQMQAQGIDALLNSAMAASNVGGKPTKAFTGEYGPTSGVPLSALPPGHPATQFALRGTPTYATVSDLSNQYYNWTQDRKDRFRAQLGLINKSALTATDDELAQTWGNYVQQSANYVANGQTISPEDILAKDVANLTAQKKSLAGTKTSTTTDTQLTGKADADAIFNSAAKSLLGRAPTQSEYAAFQASLNSAERANPVQATTTTTTDEEGNVVNQSRTSTGGLGSGGAQLLAQQQAQQNPEYGAYQAATTYWEAMMQMLQRGY